MAEWFKALVLKTIVPIVPWVRIPFCPVFTHIYAYINNNITFVWFF